MYELVVNIKFERFAETVVLYLFSFDTFSWNSNLFCVTITIIW